MQKINNILKWVAVLVCTAALVISALLLFHSFQAGSLVGCSAGSSCDAVLGSRWSRLFSLIPVAAPGFCAYAVLLVLLLFVDKLEDERFAYWMRLLTLVLAGAVTGAAVWFIYVQHRFIAAFCPYCMSVHCLGLLLGCLLLLRSVLVRLDWRRVVPAFVLGLCLAAALALTQYFTTPRYAYDSGRVEESLPDPTPLGLPLVGDEDADARVLLLYDYRCSHCRKLHAWLPELPELLSSEGKSVSFVLCPVPLSTECNPYISTDVDLFAGSCTLDKCALAVWRRKPEAFAGMDAFLFDESAFPRSEAECRAMAASLIGEDALEEELHSDWMRSYMSCVFELFGRTSTPGKGAVPRFVFADRYMVPDADSAEGLARLMLELLGNE